MTTRIITIYLKQLMYDAKSNSWKTGRIAPREDGLHGEMQISDDGMDTKMAAQLMVEGFSSLMELVKDFRGGYSEYPEVFDDDNIYQDDDLYFDKESVITGVESNYTFVLYLLDVPDRNNSTNTEISVMGHDYVLAYVMAGWYKLVDPARQASWEAKRQDAALRLVSALRYKHKLN